MNTLSKVIQELEGAEQNKSGMFELGEEIMCALMDLLTKEREAAVPVRYMNRYTGACYTLEQQPDAATDTAVYVPLFDIAQPVALPDDAVARLAYESHVRGQYQYSMLERHPDDAGPWAGEYREATRQMEWEDWLKSWNACRAAMLKQPASIQASNGEGAGTEIKQPSSNYPG